MSLFPGVNYTIVMDGAPGPNLTIGVVPNPVFTSININDITQVIGSVRIIRINVGNQGFTAKFATGGGFRNMGKN